MQATPTSPFASRGYRLLRGKPFLLVVAVWTVTAMTGCGQPKLEMSRENVALIMRLNTAVMSKRTDLLDNIADDAQQRFNAGELSQAAHDQIEAIIAAAREGEWERAQTTCLNFQKAQRPEP